jgi:hypothetical protein
MELKSVAAIVWKQSVFGFGGTVVTLRSSFVNAFYFVAYRSFVAALALRVVLITTIFVVVFATHASDTHQTDHIDWGFRVPGYTQEFAIVNYLNWQISPKDSVSLRNEYFDDANGQRTGTPNRYYGVGLNWTSSSRTSSSGRK